MDYIKFMGNFGEIIKIKLSEWNDLDWKEKEERIKLEEFELAKKYAYNFNLSLNDLRSKICVRLIEIE